MQTSTCITCLRRERNSDVPLQCLQWQSFLPGVFCCYSALLASC